MSPHLAVGNSCRTRHRPARICGQALGRIPSRRVGAFSQRDYGGLRAQITPCIGQTAAGEPEPRIDAQVIEVIEVIGLLVTARDGQPVGAQDIARRPTTTERSQPLLSGRMMGWPLTRVAIRLLATCASGNGKMAHTWHCA